MESERERRSDWADRIINYILIGMSFIWQILTLKYCMSLN